jgi:hypothetical protein
MASLGWKRLTCPRNTGRVPTTACHWAVRRAPSHLPVFSIRSSCTPSLSIGPSPLCLRLRSASSLIPSFALWHDAGLNGFTSIPTMKQKCTHVVIINVRHVHTEVSRAKPKLLHNMANSNERSSPSQLTIALYIKKNRGLLQNTKNRCRVHNQGYTNPGRQVTIAAELWSPAPNIRRCAQFWGASQTSKKHVHPCS